MAPQDILLQKFGRDFDKGTILFHEGDNQSKEMYVIHKGKVKIYKKVGNHETVLAYLGQGEFFGEMAILNNKPRSATAEVVESGTLLVIDPKTFESMIKSNAEVAFRLIKKLSDRIEETDNKIELLMIKDTNSRVVHALESLAESIGVRKDAGVFVPISEGELLSRAGVSSDHASDILEKLKKAKIITVSADAICINDMGKLRKFVEFLILKEQFGDLD
jgi:CRP/FNR family transcriptional regulator, cyclic AMP receptor protein